MIKCNAYSGRMMRNVLMKKKRGGLRGLRKFLGVSELCKSSTRKPGAHQGGTETLQLCHLHNSMLGTPRYLV